MLWSIPGVLSSVLYALYVSGAAGGCTNCWDATPEVDPELRDGFYRRGLQRTSKLIGLQRSILLELDKKLRCHRALEN